MQYIAAIRVILLYISVCFALHHQSITWRRLVSGQRERGWGEGSRRSTEGLRKEDEGRTTREGETERTKQREWRPNNTRGFWGIILKFPINATRTSRFCHYYYYHYCHLQHPRPWSFFTFKHICLMNRSRIECPCSPQTFVREGIGRHESGL